MLLRSPTLVASLAVLAVFLPEIAAQAQRPWAVPAPGGLHSQPGPALLSAFDVAQIDASPRVRLSGNVRPEVTGANDLGAVADSMPIDHVLLLLKRPAALESAFESYEGELTDRRSANYHHWLTPDEIGDRFGPAVPDLEIVGDWLALYGLRVNAVYPSRMVVDFSGTAGQIRAAFRTEIHAYAVDGVPHVANSSDPAIPAALIPVVEGIVSLHDFKPRPLYKPRVEFTAGSGVSVTHPVTPPDLATIYNLTPLFKAGITGKGETIAVVEGSDVYSSEDWTSFRSAFGLSEYTSGSFKQIHPSPRTGATNCFAPGVIDGWDEESILDAEYASASAPGAAIEVASCASTNATNGNLIALMNVVNASGKLPEVISVSYGDCEASNGAAANAAIRWVYAQAAAEGISVFAATGDGGAAFCDVGASVATDGIGVNAYASTENNVGVGGTDFSDVFSNDSSLYWNKTNTASGGSAKSYIPEAPWNDSCANPLIAAWYGFGKTFGVSGFCFQDFTRFGAFQTTTAGSGGPSGCASGAPEVRSEVDGGCRGWAKPAWQSVVGNPNDGVRDLPDLALFAADGVWGHYFLYCDSNLADSDGAPCKSGEVARWSQGGGTSFAAPIMAGIQALVSQKWGREGNPNPVYYKMAEVQFETKALVNACESGKGAETASACLFHDVTFGASTVNCEGTADCYGYVLSTNASSFQPAYPAHTGWDFASGLGSVNAYNLVMSKGW